MNLGRKLADGALGLARGLASSGRLQPRDLAGALHAAVERRKISFPARVAAPNLFRVYLHAEDLAFFEPLLETLKKELKADLAEYLKRRRYHLDNRDLILYIEAHPDLGRGEVEVDSMVVDAKEEPRPSSGAAPMPPGGVSFSEADQTVIMGPAQVCLTVMDGPDQGRRIRLERGRLAVGRGEEADVRVQDPTRTMSRRHFTLYIGQDLKLEDHSGNGTLINGLRVSRAEVWPGDHILAGRVGLEVGPCGQSNAA